MGHSVAQREGFLNYVFRGGAMATQLVTLYVVLFTTNPSDDTGTGAVEVTTAAWTNYARVAITCNSTNWSAPPGGTVSPQNTSNVAAVSFGTATIPGANPVVTGAALYDAASAGNLVTWGALGSSQAISNGDPVDFPIGDLLLQA